MVCPDGYPIGDLKNKMKPKSQDRLKVFNLAVAMKTEFALAGILILQFLNFILLWLYPLSTAVSSLVLYIRNNTHYGRPGGPDSSQRPGY